MGDEQLKILTTAENEPEAELMRMRLQSVGIEAISRRAIGGPEWGASGVRYLLVPESDLARARELIGSKQDVSEEELSRQSEAADNDPRSD